MLTCKQMTEMATDRSEGHLGSAEKERFDRHLEGCDGCRAYVRQLEVTAQALHRLPEPEISAALNDALMAQFVAARAPATSPARVSPWPVLGSVAVVGLLLAFARNRSQSPDDWMVGAALAVAALAVAAMAGRLALGVVVAAVSAAVAAALFAGGPGPLAADHGAICLSMELVAAALVGGAAWIGARGATPQAVRRSLATGAVAGALAADAALQITCGAHDATAHLLTFHAAGVLLVAAASVLALAKPIGVGSTG
jgi:predicted anti-sigma-YlaC factor YlaD